jgi:NAD(P)-dependent dehydrogenase (short-subunit alcohol dehydrogenase family)
MQVALVTGASRGVGRGVATSMNEAGFKVFATHPHPSSLCAVSLPGVRACPTGGHKRWGTAPPEM